ncbi:DNA polymerase III subunit delta [Novosphingobium sp. Gsoil 351]|uniref:DNA polymerase III subunit delta n=1 Tax=Novosphingobium sp. Gsoil 351 TaxID=2675225 RepID=UPI0012B4FC6B|nr:DNA polymerase III subunit delta [Novosphingobium sp. Gsoil 351]QGN55076.1 DNA polymerase III subunit delta [Novosphingobium sp. Gsoil 351]
MKATQANFAATAARAARECRTFYFCGPDEAGAHDAAQAIVALLPAGIERVELAGADLRKDPVLLSDEARSTSLFGGARYIFVRTAGDETSEAVENLLADEVEACPVLIVATSATDKSRVAKLLAERKDALVAMFYAPDLPAVAQAVRTMADSAGVRIDGALAERIAKACALDTRMARSEIEKLALYLDAGPQAPRTADAEALDAIGAKNEDDGFMPIVNCVLGGDVGRLSAELTRLRELSLNPVGLLLAFERRAAQLAQLAARMGPRGDVQRFMESERQARRVFFRDAPDLTNQLRRWRGKRLTRLVERLVALHRELMANSQSAGLLLAQGLTEIARAAAAVERVR